VRFVICSVSPPTNVDTYSSQIHSCAIDLAINPDFYVDRNGTSGDADSGRDVAERKCSAVFIRAPAIIKVGSYQYR